MRTVAQLGLVLAGVVVVAAAGHAAPSRPRVDAAAPKVKDAVEALQELDTKLDALIEKVETGEATVGDLSQFAIIEVFTVFHDRFPRVLGVNFVAMSDLADIDQRLEQISELKEKKAPRLKEELAEAERSARALKANLERGRKTHPAETPAAAPDVAENIANDLDSLAKSIDKHPTLTLAEIKEKAAKIAAYKHERFVAKYLTGRIFGIKEYELLMLASKAILPSYEAVNAETKAEKLSLLRAARTAKDKLIAELKEANPEKPKPACPKPGTAKKTPVCLYRFSFIGPLHMDWQWPVNPNNRDRRDSQAVDVLRGTGCGAAPAKARWTVTYQSSGLPTQSLIIDFVHGTTTNPAKLLDAQYGGVPTADVQVYVQFAGGKQPLITLRAEPHGDVLGPNIAPSSAPVGAVSVKRC